MGTTTIEWTDKTWNPVSGCSHVSEGCRNCYAERVFPRPYPGRKFTDVQCHLERLEQPLHWRKPQNIFVNSMSDLFHEDVPDEFIEEVFDRILQADWHTYQILTKRPERMRSFMVSWMAGLKVQIIEHVWLGVSVEDQQTADERIPLLLATPASIRWVSYEPALGEVNFNQWLLSEHGRRMIGAKPGIAWIVAGGESGPKARPSHPDWVRLVRDQCQAAGVPFFFKQWGEYKPISEMAERESGALYRSNRKAKEFEDQSAIDESYGKSCCVESFGVQFDGWRGYGADPGGKPAYQVFRVGKRNAGRLLDGREWNEFPVGEKGCHE